MSNRVMIRVALVAVVGILILSWRTVVPRVAATGSGEILTAAGGASGDGSAATAVPLSSPQGVAVDASGNVYIADTLGCRVRKVSGGIITTVAGTGACGYGGDGGAATSASLKGPQGVAVDASGNVYIADTGNCLIRKVSAGTITTVAGSGACPAVGNEAGGDGGPATSAHLWNPGGVAVDGSGNLYIADTGNCRVRKVSGGTITTLAGTTVIVGGFPVNCGFSGDGGPANAAWLSTLGGVALNATATDLYIADTENCRIRDVTLGSGIINTVAGTGICASGGDGGAPLSANLWNPGDVAVDGSGNVYIADTASCRIREISASIITTMAGSGSCAFGGDGGPAVPVATNLYLGGTATGSTATSMTDSSANWAVNALVGSVVTMGGSTATVTSNTATVLSFAAWSPAGPATGPYTLTPAAHAGDTTLPVVSSAGFAIGNTIRINPGGGTQEDNVVAGVAPTSISLQNPVGSDHAGGEQVIRLPIPAINTPSGVAVDSSGNVYIADTGNCRAREVSAGNLATVAGTGDCGYGGDGGPVLDSVLHSPTGVVVNVGGNVMYIADTNNCRVREVSGTTITTVAGTGTCGYGGDAGPGGSAKVDHPYGVALDSGGNLYIADTNNCRVREVSASGGTITTVAGTGTCGYGGDSGPATAAQLSPITGVAVDGSGNLYIADTGNCRIRKVSAGTITTVAGFIGFAGTATGSTATTMTDSGASWAANALVGRVVTMGGSTATITSNTATVLTFSAWSPAGPATGPYSITGSCPPSYPPHVGDGGPATYADLYYPHGVAVDSSGTNLYIADTYDCRVRKVTGGVISTIAGTGSCAYGGDGGAATSAKVNDPQAVAVDGVGNVYIADTDNCRVREVSSGVITTIAGTGSCWFAGDGGLATSAALNHPYGLSVDSAGDVYVGDSENNRVRGVYYTDTDGDGLPDGAETMMYGTNPLVADTDGDSCNDGKEVGPTPSFGGQRDPLDPWDFYNVPSPALRKNPTGTLDHGIGITTDVVALLAYTGLTSTSPDYIADYDGNGVEDGLQYDRSVSVTPGMPWRSGPPDGGIGVTTDVVAMLKQVGTTC